MPRPHSQSRLAALLWRGHCLSVYVALLPQRMGYRIACRRGGIWLIQLICCKMCPESLHVYRRIGTAKHECCIRKAMHVFVSTIQSSNVPRVVADEGYAELVEHFRVDLSADSQRLFENVRPEALSASAAVSPPAVSASTALPPASAIPRRLGPGCGRLCAPAPSPLALLHVHGEQRSRLERACLLRNVLHRRVRFRPRAHCAWLPQCVAAPAPGSALPVADREEERWADLELRNWDCLANLS